MAYKYSGNDDFRGYLAGNNHSALLKFVGNDGGIDWNSLNQITGANRGGVAGQAGKAQAKAMEKVVSTLYQNYRNAYTDKLLQQAASNVSYRPPTPQLPQFDYSANMSKARKQAASTINPVYTDKLNRYLQKQKLERAQETELRTRNKESIQTALQQAIEDIMLGRERTTEDTENKLGDIAATEGSWQRQEGRQFDQAREALMGGVADAGLTESGLAQGQIQNAVTDRNLASEDQTREFDTARRDTEIFRTRTLADLDTTEEREKGTAKVRTENEDIALRNFIDNQKLDERATRAELEYERISKIDAAAQAAFQKILDSTARSLARSGTSAQDIALLKQIYG